GSLALVTGSTTGAIQAGISGKNVTIQGGLMTLDGDIAGNLTNSAILQLTFYGRVDGNFTQTATGILKYTVDASTVFETNAFYIQANVTLAGTLAISVINGSPKQGDVYYVIDPVSGTTVTGTFSTITGGSGFM